MKLPVIETKRLILKPISRADVKAIYAYAKHPDVGPPAGWMPHTSVKETHEFIDFIMQRKKTGQPGPWSIYHREDRTVIGTIELHSFREWKAEIGFALGKDYWRQGIMKEAAIAVLIVAFEDFGLSRISYKHFVDNEASRALRASLGFVEEGIKRNGFKHADGRILDEVVSSMILEDYKKRFNQQFKAAKAMMQVRYDDTI